MSDRNALLIFGALVCFKLALDLLRHGGPPTITMHPPLVPWE